MSRSNFFKIIFILILTLPIFNSIAGNRSKVKNEKTIKVLTIGNSFAENACMYLKQITESVEGCKIVIEKANLGGCSLDRHANLIIQSAQDSNFKPYNGKSLKDKLEKDTWDVVTIQQVSSLSFKPESFQPYADTIVEYVKKFAPTATIYIHETWSYAPDCKRLKEFGISNQQMYQGLKANYTSLAKRYGAPILPSGDAFFLSLKKNADLDLWNKDDRYHASSNGCYLAGCVWFDKLFGVSAKSIRFKPSEMDARTAEYLRMIAARTNK